MMLYSTFRSRSQRSLFNQEDRRGGDGMVDIGAYERNEFFASAMIAELLEA